MWVVLGRGGCVCVWEKKNLIKRAKEIDNTCNGRAKKSTALYLLVGRGSLPKALPWNIHSSALGAGRLDMPGFARANTPGQLSQYPNAFFGSNGLQSRVLLFPRGLPPCLSLPLFPAEEATYRFFRHLLPARTDRGSYRFF